MNIVLIGYRGSGKTTIGREVARRMKMPFFDADEQIVKRAGKTIKDIFAQDGEPAFRDMETHVVKWLMKQTNHVISLGGGAVQREENQKAVMDSKGTVVFLRCDPETLHERIQADVKTAETRPALTSRNGVDEIRHLLKARQPGYLAVMTNVLDVSTLTVEQSVDKIIRMVS